MKTGVLLIWTVCLASIALSLLHFAWVAAPRERLLSLALILAVACAADRRAPRDPVQ